MVELLLTSLMIALTANDVASLSIENASTLKDYSKNVLPKQLRSKRLIRQAFDNCSFVCNELFETKIDTVLPRLRKVYEEFEHDPLSTPQFDDEEFSQFCLNVYKPFDECLSKCPTSKAKTMSEISHGINRMICIDNYDEFSKYLPCFMKIKTETNNRCINDVCKDHKDAMKSLLQAKSNLTGLDRNKIRSLIADNCRLIECVKPCEFQVIENVCGVDVLSSYKKVLKVSMEMSPKILQENNLLDLWPEECDDGWNKTKSNKYIFSNTKDDSTRTMEAAKLEISTPSSESSSTAKNSSIVSLGQVAVVLLVLGLLLCCLNLK